MSGKAYGVAIFGLGRAGTIHFGNLICNNRARVLYVVDIDMEKCQQVINDANLSAKAIHPDNKQLVYDDERVVGVLVCSPTFTHDDIVRGALQHKKHVFCEKPVSETIEGVSACYNDARLANRRLLCSFNRRFDPSIVEIKRRVKSGEVGDIHSVKTCSRDHPLPKYEFLKISGGLFHDCASHDIDMVCWILEEYPISVFAMGHANNQHIKDMNDIDTAVIVCKFASNIIVTLDLSRHANYGYDQRLEILGSKGMLQSQNQLPNGVVMFDQSGIKGSCLKHSFPQRYRESYENAMEHFMDILGGKDVCVEEEDVINTCKVASACEESYNTGLPVTLRW